ncbi:hypothetical protein J2T57_001456 [Natronocella acetinitrilica]|uniref:Uncharacterized protein n=1 Tax=Natronocella acetinitrilica TaxID=414046 RepID=A0AAE3G3G0_9GAMM|nr:hypothetical protein [Natronocella acetinitrilica]MCP1674354.1 hypothetical protein [Natronocella acetinitrilica]
MNTVTPLSARVPGETQYAPEDLSPADRAFLALREWIADDAWLFDTIAPVAIYHYADCSAHFTRAADRARGRLRARLSRLDRSPDSSAATRWRLARRRHGVDQDFPVIDLLSRDSDYVELSRAHYNWAFHWVATAHLARRAIPHTPVVDFYGAKGLRIGMLGKDERTDQDAGTLLGDDSGMHAWFETSALLTARLDQLVLEAPCRFARAPGPAPEVQP